jgi:crossover junction endodeoxyribonuclease RusA
MPLFADPEWCFELMVPGRPAPQGSKRHVGNGVMVESSKAVGAWRELVAYSVARSWRTAPLEGPVRVRLSFVMPRPVATPKRRTPPAIKKPDVDKLGRAMLDALTGVCWRDDSQVVELHATKRLAELDEIPGALIQIGRFEIGKAA